MIRIVIPLMVLVLAIVSSHGDELLFQADLPSWEKALLPDGVTAKTAADGRGTILRLTNSNPAPVSVILEELPLQGVSDTRLNYEAHVAGEDLEAPAYLEMWAVLGENAYFSRALNDPFSGTQTERQSATPFLLKAGDTLEAVRLGIHFEGPGTITLRNVSLWKRQGGKPVVGQGLLGGILGSLFGVGSGIWAIVAFTTAQKGIGRTPVLGITLGLVVLSALALVAGLVLWIQGSPWAVWYVFALLGVIGLANFSVVYRSLHKRYGQAEARRMAAMDLG